MAVEQLEVLVVQAVIAISVLVFAAKVLGGLIGRFGFPEVIGEIAAGVIFGPFAIGGLIKLRFFAENQELVLPLVPPLIGESLTVPGAFLRIFAEMGAIILLFAAGLESTFAEFRAAGGPSFVVGVSGVVVPFALGYFVPLQFGFTPQVALLIGAALTATSIAVTVRALEDLNQIHTEEARIMINAAVIDDVLGLAVLAVVTSVFAEGVRPGFFQILLKTGETLGLWLVLLVSGVFVLPRFIHLSNLWRAEGVVEAAATAAAFGFAALAFALQLSPIVGAFAAGMAIAGSHLIGRIKEYIEKLKLVFGPIFFALVGAFLDPAAAAGGSVLVFVLILAVAIVSKIVGCGLPAALFLRDLRRGARVGYGMSSRGEVGFIILGIGLAQGILTRDVYAALLTVVMATTIISPILLRNSFATGPGAAPEPSAGTPQL